MDKEKLFASLVVFALITSNSYGWFMGSPSAPTGRDGKIRIGAVYSYKNFDIDVGGLAFGDHAGSKISHPKNLRLNTLQTYLGYSVCDQVEVFGLLGGTRGKAEIGVSGRGHNDIEDGQITTYGFGTRFTLWQQQPNLTWGGLFMMNIMQNMYIDGVYSRGGGAWFHTVRGELDLMRMQIALGPTYQLCDYVKLYGGPYLEIVDGSFQQREFSSAAGAVRYHTDDVDQAAWFGGYIGAQIMLANTLPFNIEWQHTAHGNTLGMGLFCPIQ